MDIEDLMGQPGAAEDPTANSPLKSLKVDLDFYSESIKEVSIEMIAEGYTLYPIFIAHQHEVSLGEVLLNKDELNTAWSINVSSLEDFVERGLIKEALEENFKRNYKDANTHMCVFVVVPEGANFVYYPYK